MLWKYTLARYSKVFVKICSMHTKHTIFVLFGQQKLGIIRYDEFLPMRFDDLIQKWDVSTQYSFCIISFVLGIIQ
jgi:hypothetical protein